MIDKPPFFCYDKRKKGGIIFGKFPLTMKGFTMINVCDINVMKPLLAELGFHFSKA